MPLRIGIMLYPLLPVALVLMKRGPVSKFIQAGAVSPETARRPQSLKATDVGAAERSGVLVRVEDGLYYVNLDRYRRQRRRLMMWVMALVALHTASMLWIWWPEIQRLFR